MADLDDREISLFIEENRNVNTTKKTKTDLKSVKETTAIEIPAEELNNLLCHLFVKVRRRNPSFLRSCLQQMHNCCGRNLHRNSHPKRPQAAQIGSMCTRRFH